MLRVYYHLYPGPSWRRVWSLHQPLLQTLCAQPNPCRVIVCTVGGTPTGAPLWQGDPGRFELRNLPAGPGPVNEFHTLQQLQHDARHAPEPFQHCAYMHSKGSSSAQLSAAGAAWSQFLARALVDTLPGFQSLVDAGFTAAGSNLAVGLFEDFGPPRIHYSGNFWCCTRGTAAAACDIALGGRRAAVRHRAEWWLSTSPDFIPFNVFCTGIDHYSGGEDSIDWNALQARLRALALPLERLPAPQRTQQRHAFIQGMLRRCTGRAPLRRIVSNALLSMLPHHRAPRLLHVHDALMRRLGSRKSSYFYCPESR